MYFRVNHTINNPKEFWSRAQESLPNLPEGIAVHGVYPNEAMDRATCIWEARDMDHIKEYLEDKTGDVSHNEYMPINEANAMGLPK